VRGRIIENSYLQLLIKLLRIYYMNKVTGNVLCL
jgi:hypothetical protein